MTTPSPTLREKREQWLEAFSGKDCHAISTQLIEMTWDMTSFNMINEARRFAPSASHGGVQINALLHNLLNKGFFTLQMNAIRRLTDIPQNKAKGGVCLASFDGDRGVYSLGGLLKDMQNHHDLLTREAIFNAEGLIYDSETLQRRLHEFTRGKKNGDTYHPPRELDLERHQERQYQIDILTHTTPHTRQPTDKLGEDVFINLTRKIQHKSEVIKTYVDKYIAHAATPESRTSGDANDISVTLGQLRSAHEVLCQVASFVSCYLLGSFPRLFHSISPGDRFEYVDKPLASSDQIAELRQRCDDLSSQSINRCQWDLDQYRQEFP